MEKKSLPVGLKIEKVVITQIAIKGELRLGSFPPVKKNWVLDVEIPVYPQVKIDPETKEVKIIT